MALTNDGARLYSALDPLYKTIAKSIQHVQYTSTPPLRVLRIVEPSTYDYMQDFDELKEIVKSYESKYPDVKVHEVLCEFKELRQALEYGNADIVITEDFGVRGITGISKRLLSAFDMYVAISGKHPLAHSDELDFSALANEYYPINMRNKPHVSVAWRSDRLSPEIRNFIDMLPREPDKCETG